MPSLTFNERMATLEAQHDTIRNNINNIPSDPTKSTRKPRAARKQEKVAVPEIKPEVVKVQGQNQLFDFGEVGA